MYTYVSILLLIIKGIWVIINNKVIGRAPKTLKFTQVSSVKFCQITSLVIAIIIKKNIKRILSCRHFASSLKEMAFPKTILVAGCHLKLVIKKISAKTIYNTVGFILIKTLLPLNNVKLEDIRSNPEEIILTMFIFFSIT